MIGFRLSALETNKHGSTEGITMLRIPIIPPMESVAEAEARAWHAALTKPPGKLGRLEVLRALLAVIKGQPRPAMGRKAVTVVAADHGVTVESVSAHRAAVTPQMALNFVRSSAAIKVLARRAAARVVVVAVAPRPTSARTRGCWHATWLGARKVWRLGRR